MKQLLFLALLLPLKAEADANGSYGVSRLSCEALLGTGNATLSWLAPENLDAVGIRILRGDLEVASLDLTATTFTDSPPLADGESMEVAYTVRTFGGTQGDSCPPLTCSAMILNGGTSSQMVVKLHMNGDGEDTSRTAGPIPTNPPLPNNDAEITGEVNFPARLAGQAAEFDAEGEFMSMENSDELSFGSDVDFTISLITRFDDAPHSSAVLMANKDISDSINPGWALFANPNGSWSWSLSDGTTQADFQSAAEILSDGQWHHLLVVHDRDGLATFYSDGEKIGEISIALVGDIDALDTGIAVDGTSESSTFIGGIDEVQVWRRRLIPAEIPPLERSLATFVCPSDFQAVVNSFNAPDSAELSWTAPYNLDLDGYELLRNEVLVTTVSTNATSYVDHSPVGSEVRYTLRPTGPDASLCPELKTTASLRSRPLDSMLVHLNFDDDAIDYSGQGNDGTLNGTPTIISGIRGNSFLFDDLADERQFVSLGTPDALQFGDDQDFTISVWIRNEGGFPDRTHLGGSANDPGIISNKNSSFDSNIGWHLGAGPNYRWQWSFSDGENTETLRSNSGALSDGVWHHLMIAHDRNGLAIFYFNGELFATKDISSVGSVNTSFPIGVGTDGSNASGSADSVSPSWFSGQIDEVKIWNRVFGPSEAQEIYKSDRAIFDWQSEQLPDGLDASFLADPDGDGITNLFHFATSDQPVGSPALAQPHVKIRAPFPEITYRRRRGGIGHTGRGYFVDGISYHVEQSSSLLDGDWTNDTVLFEQVGDAVILSETIEEVTIRSVAPLSYGESRFLRLRVVAH